jgi:hypothetical protein
MKPMLKAPGNMCLNLKSDELLSKFAFKFNLHRYMMEMGTQLLSEDKTMELLPHLVRLGGRF